MKRLVCFAFFMLFISSVHGMTLATWNVQTFFDSTTEGTEYEQFIENGAKWNDTQYLDRCKRTANIIAMIDADVIILEEIEGENCLIDLYNQTPNFFDLKRVYKYATFAKEEGASIGIGVFSRKEIYDVRLHSVYLKDKNAATTRPIISFKVKDKARELTIFANHWKSKRGNGENIRALQEKTLSFFIRRETNPVVALGDFNMDNREFVSIDGKKALRAFSKADTTLIQSVWDTSSINSGSYVYRGEWERIDNIFYTFSVLLETFCVIREEELIDENGFPKGFSLYKKGGYSDHLPLKASIKL